MILPQEIKKVAPATEFILWAANVGAEGICDFTRASGFRVDEDEEHITFFVPNQFFALLAPNLKERPSMSFLMASMKDFESYQIKGTYVNHCKCTQEDMDYCRDKVLKIVEITESFGLNGKSFLGYLTEQPNTAVKMFCKDVFIQTPYAGTGNHLNS